VAISEKWRGSAVHETFQYAEMDSSGLLDRGVLNGGSEKCFARISESSAATCHTETTCSPPSPIDPHLALCELGPGASVIHEPYAKLPGLDSALRGNHVPWLPFPVGFVELVPGMRDVIGY